MDDEDPYSDEKIFNFMGGYDYFPQNLFDSVPANSNTSSALTLSSDGGNSSVSNTFLDAKFPDVNDYFLTINDDLSNRLSTFRFDDTTKIKRTSNLMDDSFTTKCLAIPSNLEKGPNRCSPTPSIFIKFPSLPNNEFNQCDMTPLASTQSTSNTGSKQGNTTLPTLNQLILSTGSNQGDTTPLASIQSTPNTESKKGGTSQSTSIQFTPNIGCMQGDTTPSTFTQSTPNTRFNQGDTTPLASTQFTPNIGSKQGDRIPPSSTQSTRNTRSKQGDTTPPTFTQFTPNSKSNQGDTTPLASTQFTPNTRSKQSNTTPPTFTQFTPNSRSNQGDRTSTQTTPNTGSKQEDTTALTFTQSTPNTESNQSDTTSLEFTQLTSGSAQRKRSHYPASLESEPKLKKRSSKKRPEGDLKCMHCGTVKTPQWRSGPQGPKSLCNACGVRFKSDRLYPEYRPAASPTFKLNEHSNTHRKVLDIRRQRGLDLPPPIPQQPQSIAHVHQQQQLFNVPQQQQLISNDQRQQLQLTSNCQPQQLISDFQNSLSPTFKPYEHSNTHRKVINTQRQRQQDSLPPIPQQPQSITHVHQQQQLFSVPQQQQQLISDDQQQLLQLISYVQQQQLISDFQNYASLIFKPDEHSNTHQNVLDIQRQSQQDSLPPIPQQPQSITHVHHQQQLFSVARQQQLFSVAQQQQQQLISDDQRQQLQLISNLQQQQLISDFQNSTINGGGTEYTFDYPHNLGAPHY